MNHNRFDDFTRALAQGTSRRQALKVLGGSLLAALVPGSAFAKGGGNSECAKFCAQVFGADTPAAKQCTSDAAKGKGLCYQCGPAAPAGHGLLCGQTCCTTSVAHATATCSNGTCGFTCNQGYKECNGACISTSQCCSAADCQTPANATATCTNGMCGVTCTTGYKLCNGTCILNTDCCNCAPGQICQNGTCVAANGHIFNCNCTDGSSQSFCRPEVCDGNTLFSVCQGLCSSSGGGNVAGGTSCVVAATCVLS